MIIYQRTPEWYMARCGKPTASQAWRIMAIKRNGDYTLERNTYMVELISEKLTGSVAERFITNDMQRGIDKEDDAIREYETRTGLICEPGYWVDAGEYGCTPDAFVETDGLLSVKCPRSTTMIRQRLFETEVSLEYYWQIIAELAATGRFWCDLALYDDRFMYDRDRLWVRRISRDSKAIADWCKALNSFVYEMHDRLNGLVD